MRASHIGLIQMWGFNHHLYLFLASALLVISVCECLDGSTDVSKIELKNIELTFNTPAYKNASALDHETLLPTDPGGVLFKVHLNSPEEADFLRPTRATTVADPIAVTDERTSWQIARCPLRRFTIKFSIKPAELDHDRAINHILTVLIRENRDVAELQSLQFLLTPHGVLSVDWNTVHTFTEAFKPENVTLTLNEWNHLSVVVRLKTDEVVTDVITPAIKKNKKAGQYSAIAAASLKSRPRRSLETSLRGIPTNRLAKVEAMDFTADAFVRYDFRNRLKKTAQREELTIDFELPTGAEDGLIWFSENESSKSYVYLKNSRLYYTYVIIDHTGRAQLTLTEEIFLNTPLAPNVPHVLSLIRDRDNLTLTLNERSHASKSIDGRIPLVPSDGHAYLGGSENPLKDTGGKVKDTFRGRITKAQVKREGDKKVDLLQVATDIHWQDSVRKGGKVEYEYKEPKVKLIISPTASRPHQSSWNKGGSPMALALSLDAIAITFMGTQSSVVRFDTWDFNTYRSFEIEFMTYEPNGILFFVGPDREHTDFVCVELFDGNLYFVYAVGDHYRHIQLNSIGIKVNTGMSNRVYVSRNEAHRFLVKFNDRVVDVDQGTVAHQTEFATYTYIGSVDQPSRLPWHVWSRENFAGCISSIRVNDDKFLDPSSRMSQHTDVSRGIRFGECRIPDRRCNREICGGGQCAERSYPFFEPLNYACDCSGSDKTYREGVHDIRRSEPCHRDSPILEIDGEMVFLVDFERQMNTMATHTDDISLQFKTQQGSVPIFYAVSPADKSYFRVDLIGGRIRIQTNINYPDNRMRSEEFFLASSQLNDNQWHTLRIRRRAEHLAMSVDNGDDDTGIIPLQSHLKTFKLVAQQIYLGSAGPSNFERPPPPTSEIKFMPPPPRFVGEFRNFFWNEYDFIGTGALQSKYTTDMLTPRAIAPTFPQWPREPTYSITVTPKLQYVRLEKLIDIQSGGDMWLIEFKTAYEGVLLDARASSSGEPFQLTLILLRGRLHVVYSIYGRAGVHQITSGPAADKLDDGNWHRIVIGLERRKKQLVAHLDSYPHENIGNGLQISRVKHVNFYFGGLPETEWRTVWNLIKTYSPGSLQMSEAEQGTQPALTGCLGGFSMRSDKFASDLLRLHDPYLKDYPPNEMVRGFCREQLRCTSNYCYHGRCEVVSDRDVRCICSGTGFEGRRCEIPVLECPLNYCNQRGTCSMINGHPKCDCTGTGYHGERCESNPCSTGLYCLNGGACSIRGTLPYCDCRGTGYRGDKCQDHICTSNYCYNRGRCRVGADEKPVCECQGTGYAGARCEQPACTSSTCDNGGQCLVNVYGTIECNCAGTGFKGPHCRIPVCTSEYCGNRGRCVLGPNDQPRCECRGTGYTGDRCQQPVCTDGYCVNGGRCSIGSNNQPRCECRGTGYAGDRCQHPICTDGYCANGGRCSIDSNSQPRCECRGTGYTGDRCQQPVCTDGYCVNGGRCSIGSNSQPRCECVNTGFTGDRCHIPICTEGYCSNGGRCVVGPNNRPQCECIRPGYTGERCHIRICPDGYCSNGGRCSIGPGSQPVCECSGTGYGGTRCSDPVCHPGYCQNGGQCFLNPTGQPSCNCERTGHTGSRCETSICSPGYCLNNGQCTVGLNNQPICSCAGTEHHGTRCETPICTPGYCLHGGLCRISESGQPICDCLLTNYQGSRCEQPICPKSYCAGRGLCVVRQRQPTCDCHSGYRGNRCEVEVCPENFCINGGFCSPGADRRPTCTCPINYEGDRCELPKVCPSDYCFHGGRCTMNRGVPQCDCLGTDYTGSRCEVAQTCPVGFCQNSGRCSVKQGNYVCECEGTGYRGVICNEPIACPPNYCLYGGVCSVLPGKQYVCDCSRTARTGKHCEGSSNGIYVGYEKDGYLIYPLSPPVRTVDDNVTLGFRTYMQSGTLLTFLTSDGRHWAIKLRDGRIMVDVDGKNVYAFRMRSNDGHYHVLNIERKGDTMIVTQDTEVIRVHLPALVNPVDKSITYNSLHVSADEKKSDIFRGVVGGLYWNGRYPVNDLKDGRVTHTGEVTIVLTPEFLIPPPKPQPVCTPGYCLNQGVCYAENYQLNCDCGNSGWNGARCERQSRGFQPQESKNGAFMIYQVKPPKRTNNDEMRVAFQTWSKNGPIARVVQTDASFYDVVLLDGKLMISFNGNQYIPISSSHQEFDDGRMHVITVRRKDRQFNATVDGYLTEHASSNFVGVDGSLITQEIVLGADRQFKRNFDGVLGAFYWNGYYLIDDRGAISSDAKVMAVPGRKPAKNMEEVVVVLMPHLLRPTTTHKPGPPKPLPDGLPEGAIAGGVVMPGLGTGNVNLGAPIIAPGKFYGGGAAEMNAGTGLMLKQAGGILGLGGLVNALLAGLLLALLLLIAALIWACWRCKPGCCAFCYGKSGARKGTSASDRMVALCCAAPSGHSKESTRLLANGNDVPDVMTIPPYGQNPKLDIQQADNTHMAPVDQPILIPDQNIYNIDGLKVDSVLITKNSKYFVTGSGMGPPRVWDAQSGEVYKIMEGNELGCTDLHLACDDSVLVTQVVDDLGGGMDTITDMNTIRVKRLQLWDFASGCQLAMPIEVMCTSTCLARLTSHVIVARCTRNGQSILVWNLTANQPEHEIVYDIGDPMFRDNVSFLKISLDDRLVVAGFKNEDQAHYMVFDLAANYPSVAQPRIITFDADVNATEVIGPDSAVTGTNKGDLLVWSLHTGEIIRQINISATLEGGNTTALPPHSGIIHCVYLSEDQQYLVTGSQDQLVRVWNMPEERLLHSLEGHTDDVLSVTMSKDSELIVSGSWDGSIRVWRIRDGNQICWFSSNIEILQVKISNDKQSLVALGERGGHRKLITLRVIRNRFRTTATLRGGGSRALSMSPPTPGMSPGSPPHVMA